MESLKIRSLTVAEARYIKLALQTLYNTSEEKSNARWAAGIMMEDKFIDSLLYTEESK